jgi:HAD superfamily hydrolase (TIGR01509 family)
MNTSYSIKGVLFDLDGTLTLPGAIDFQAIKYEIGCPPGYTILEYIESRPGTEKRRLLSILKEKEILSARNSHPNIGAEDCIARLKDMGIKIGIFTRNTLESVLLTLKRFPSINEKDFCVIITRDDPPPKPHPAGILKAVRIMGINPQELLFVGDFLFDIAAGTQAGVVTVYLTNMKSTVFPDGHPHPHYIIHHLEELPTLIESIAP